MPNMPDSAISISVQTRYLKEQSHPAQPLYAFAYHITIHNQGKETVTLLTRHWIITDSDGKRQEVQGEGVVGQQPTLAPGESFDYSSGATLKTPVGTMEGSYGMVTLDGTAFNAAIPPFLLAVPGSIN
ncbi:MAG: Co2+/Mg2+ efflux protein ApaG [Porticoccaceae bacterium]|nr:Co2+/Mg2+ efflux protein ApaG [Porticoccaceae bacterium]